MRQKTSAYALLAFLLLVFGLTAFKNADASTYPATVSNAVFFGYPIGYSNYYASPAPFPGSQMFLYCVGFFGWEPSCGYLYGSKEPFQGSVQIGSCSDYGNIPDSCTISAYVRTSPGLVKADYSCPSGGKLTATSSECSVDGLLTTVLDPYMHDGGGSAAGDNLELYCRNGIIRTCLSGEYCPWRGNIATNDTDTCSRSGLGGDWMAYVFSPTYSFKNLIDFYCNGSSQKYADKPFPKDEPYYVCDDSFTFRLCQNGIPYAGVPIALAQGESRNLTAYYDTGSGCSGTAVTSSATFSSSAPTVGVLSGTDPKVLTGDVPNASDPGQQAASSSVAATYSGQTVTMPVTVLENCVSRCSSKSENYCTEQSFKTKDSCDAEETCAGTRVCNLNLKEVPPGL